MTDSLHRDICAAIQDAGVSRDERGLMPLAEARALVASLVVYAKAPSQTSNVLGSDLAWAALLSLADADEFLAAALRIRWQFHVRGRDNVAAYARFGDAILPWIAAAVGADGTLRNVPWCLYPCLMAMGTAEALALALSIRGIDGSLEAEDDGEGEEGEEEDEGEDEGEGEGEGESEGEDEGDDESEGDDEDEDEGEGDGEGDDESEGDDEGEDEGEGELNLGLGPQWLGTDMSGRLPLIAALAAGDARAKALLASTVANLGAPALAMLGATLGGEAAAEAALGALGIALPVADADVEAGLADLPRASVPAGPPWSVVDLDRDDMFPYWNVLDGYETPYAVRVSAFADPLGDVLIVQRFVRDQRASEPGTRQVEAYGPGASRFDRTRRWDRLIAEDDVSGLHLQLGDTYQAYVEGLTEVTRLFGDADEHGQQLPDAYDERHVRNPMPPAEALIGLNGHDLGMPPQLPAAWQAVALAAADGDAARAEAMLRSIDPGEGLLLRLAADHREQIFLGADALRSLASLSPGSELLFELDDPELPLVFQAQPASLTPPWPLICEALRQRVRLDPARIERIDVLRRRLLWTDERCGAPDHWGPEMPPCEPLGSTSPGIGASPHADVLLARGWPHGVRLLHQHPHNDSAAAVLDWLLAQPALPLRSHWAREVALRFVRHVGGDAAARDHVGWIYPAEARVLFATLIGRSAATHGPLAAEVAVLLLEAFVGTAPLLSLAHDALAALSESERSAPHPDGFSALLALGWVLHRAASPEAAAARETLVALAPGFPREADLGRALDLVLGGDDGARRSARTPSEWLFADPATIAASTADGPLPLDLQFVVILGDHAIARWEQQSIPAADREWFAGELDLLASPRAAALAASLRG